MAGSGAGASSPPPSSCRSRSSARAARAATASPTSVDAGWPPSRALDFCTSSKASCSAATSPRSAPNSASSAPRRPPVARGLGRASLDDSSPDCRRLGSLEPPAVRRPSMVLTCASRACKRPPQSSRRSWPSASTAAAALASGGGAPPSWPPRPCASCAASCLSNCATRRCRSGAWQAASGTASVRGAKVWGGASSASLDRPKSSSPRRSTRSAAVSAVRRASSASR
mmetsp:Transcript_53438/g.159508  ORF Transcript_53438/g.159508 Transcript_53438/m.159508 type:complete len:227 (-) Transcript_53438:336-1016(-)